MSRTGASVLGSFGDIGKLTDLRRRLVFLALAMVVFRVGTHIPVPGIDPAALARLFNQHSGGILDMFNMFSGGALKRLSIFALGVMPYISASIIMQMLAVVVPSLEQLRKEGPSGQRIITRYTRYATVGLVPLHTDKVKVILAGELKKKVALKGVQATKGAKAAIEAAGGKLED